MAVGVSGVQEWGCLAIDYIQFYVDDAERWRRYYTDIWNFSERSSWNAEDTLHIWLSHANIHLLVSQALTTRSPVARGLKTRAQGVADIGLRVRNLDRAIAHLRDRCHLETLPTWNDGRDRGVRLQTPFGIRHTLIERLNEMQSKDALLPAAPPARPVTSPEPDIAFTHVDHAVLNVESDGLAPAMQWYADTLLLEPLDRFDIQTPYSGLRSVVMGCRDRGLQLPINEPAHARSQVQEFLDANGGAGIQHIALHSSNIERSVETLRDRGVEFLAIPSTYYDRIRDRPELSARAERLRSLHLLADLAPPDRLLLQTFARPLFGEPTFFYEIVQRQQRALGFGEGNFQALYEAIEREQHQRASA